MHRKRREQKSSLCCTRTRHFDWSPRVRARSTRLGRAASPSLASFGRAPGRGLYTCLVSSASSEIVLCLLCLLLPIVVLLGTFPPATSQNHHMAGNFSRARVHFRAHPQSFSSLGSITLHDRRTLNLISPAQLPTSINESSGTCPRTKESLSVRKKGRLVGR